MAFPVSNQQGGGVVVQNRGILLNRNASAASEVGSRFAEIAVIKFVFAGDKVARRSRSAVVRLLQAEKAPRPDQLGRHG